MITKNLIVDIKKIFSILFFSFICLSASAQVSDPLRKENEITILSFRMERAPKYVSICMAKDANNPYIVYRYGTPERIDLEYPFDLKNSFDYFKYTNYLQNISNSNNGFDLNYLEFTYSEWKYIIYEEHTYDAENNFTTNIGVKAISLKANISYDLKGMISTIHGSMIFLRGKGNLFK